VEIVEYSISVWLMSNPAVTFQKPNPEAIFARARFSAALRIAPQARNTMTAHSTT
jgi:hypothetical protein